MQGIKIRDRNLGEDPELEQIVNYTMLYDFGDECYDVTNGWKGIGLTNPSWSSGAATIPTVNKWSNRLNFVQANSKIGGIVTKNLFNVGEYSKIAMVYEGTKGTSSGAMLYLFQTEAPTKIDESVFYSKVFTLDDSVSGTENKTFKSFDISNVIGMCSVCVNLTQTVNMSAYNIFVVKADDSSRLPTSDISKIASDEKKMNKLAHYWTGDKMLEILTSPSSVAILKSSPHLHLLTENPHWAKFMQIIPTAKSLLNYTMAYDFGDECVDITGGWGGSGNAGNVAKYPQHIGGTVLSGTCYMRTNSAFNASEYYGQFALGQNAVYYSGGRSYYGLTSNESGSGYPFKSMFALTSNGYTGSESYIQYVNGGFEDTFMHMPIKSDILYSISNIRFGCQMASQIAFRQYAMGLYKRDNYSLLGYSSAEAIIASIDDIANDAEKSTILSGMTGDVMVGVCNNADAMNAICSSIAYDILLAHPCWKKFMLMSQISLSAMNNVSSSIPAMTNNTTPSGVCSVSYSNQNNAYRAFDKKSNTWVTANIVSYGDSWVQYEFPNQIIPYRFSFRMDFGQATGNTAYFCREMVILGSNDGVNFEQVAYYEQVTNSSSSVARFYAWEDSFSASVLKPFKYIRFFIKSLHLSGNHAYVDMLQAYGKAVQ